MRIICTIVLVMLNHFATAQQCNCKENFLRLVEMITEDYPGYNDKAPNVKYHQVLDSLSTKSSSLTDEYSCYTLLRSFANFFKDPHLIVTINNTPENKESLKKMFLSVQDTFMIATKTPVANKSLPITGVWELKNQGTDYRVKIHVNGIGNYIGSIIDSDSVFWHPGQTKFIIIDIYKNIYKVLFFLRDHTPVLLNASYDTSGILDMKGYGVWQKVVSNIVNSSKRDSALAAMRNICVKSIDDSTAYLRIPSFSLINAKRLEDAININSDQFKKKNLIIDLRSNSGGSTIVSSLLLKFVYDKPIVYQGSSFLNSRRNFDDLKTIFSRPEFQSNYQSIINEKIDFIRTSPVNSLVVYSKDTIETLDSIYDSPERIFVLVDRFSASTTEYFLLEAQQSNKVKIVGQNTRGAIDYTDIGLPRVLPCSLFYLQTPMVRSDGVSVHKLDNVGIKPDIIVPEEQDSLMFLLNMLKNE